MMGRAISQRRGFLISAGASVLFYGIFGASARAEPVQRILSIVYSGSFGLDPNIENLANDLAATGAMVTSIWGPGSGRLAELLSQNTYDQIYIWDMQLGPPDGNPADRAALLAWWNASPRNIVLDSRATALFYENDASEQRFCRNIVANFGARGGGLWIGAKYAPQGARTANAFLTGLDPNAQQFTGSFDNFSGVTGSDNPLLTTPNLVDPAGLRYWYLSSFSRSVAPTTGPGGIPLETVIRDAEMHPLITTNIPEPGFLGVGAGSALVFATGWRKRRTQANPICPGRGRCVASLFTKRARVRGR